MLLVSEREVQGVGRISSRTKGQKAYLRIFVTLVLQEYFVRLLSAEGLRHAMLNRYIDRRPVQISSIRVRRKTSGGAPELRAKVSVYLCSCLR